MRMAEFNYRIVNVFAEERLAGNPLAVFEDARGMDEFTMQALALQFNLSETAYLLPSETATARVRIFSPANEMPFAGHPTLGSAYVVRSIKHCGNTLNLEMISGVIPVTASGDVFSLQVNAAKWRPVRIARDALASMLGLVASDLGEQPLWVNTGNEHLLAPLASPDAVARCRPEPLLAGHHPNEAGTVKIYVWAETGDAQVAARFFFSRQSGSITEDPGTGSACANLGGWMLATKEPLPLMRLIYQGDRVGRPCRLRLRVDAAGTIFVAGRVIELGRGVVSI
jgi:trans-2,3-dihydro-3-hydroxyanthranilate isomerase